MTNGILEEDMEVEEISKKNWLSVKMALNEIRQEKSDMQTLLKAQSDQMAMLTERLMTLEQRVGMLTGRVMGSGATA